MQAVGPLSDVEVRAPEWSGHGIGMLLARLLLALVLSALAFTIFGQASNVTPEESSPAVLDSLADQAVKGSDTVGRRLANRQSARGRVETARGTLRTALQAQPQVPAQVATARADLSTALGRLQQARRLYSQAVNGRAQTLTDYAALRRTTDGDLARVIGLYAAALLSVVSAAALLVPRRSSLLTVRRPVADKPDTGGPGGGGSGPLSGSGDAQGLDVPVVPAPVLEKIKNEPVAVQGVVLTSLLFAGFLGVQNTQDTQQTVIAVAMVVAPLVTAAFTRARVVPRGHLSVEEQERVGFKPEAPLQ